MKSAIISALAHAFCSTPVTENTRFAVLTNLQKQALRVIATIDPDNYLWYVESIMASIFRSYGFVNFCGTEELVNYIREANGEN